MFSKGRSSEEVAYKLYTGLENFRPTIINPNLAELKEMGVNEDTEPVYLTTERDEDGNDYQRLQVKIYVENDNEEHPIKNHITFFLENRKVIAQSTGKIEYINKYGQTCYLDDPNNIPPQISKWFHTDGMRPSYRNEKYLILFFHNFLNLSVKNKDQAYLEGIERMFETGNIAPLRKALLARPKNQIKLLCGVRTVQNTENGQTTEKYYQNLYPRNFLRSYTKPGTIPFEKFKEELKNYKLAGGAPSTDYGDIETLRFQEWTIESSKNNSDSSSMARDIASDEVDDDDWVLEPEENTSEN